MPQFRKKPVVIDAERWTASGFEGGKWPEWLKQPLDTFLVQRDGDSLLITTLEGVMRADPGDWVIRGVENEIYPCKNSVFEATYEPAD